MVGLGSFLTGSQPLPHYRHLSAKPLAGLPVGRGKPRVGGTVSITVDMAKRKCYRFHVTSFWAPCSKRGMVPIFHLPYFSRIHASASGTRILTRRFPIRKTGSPARMSWSMYLVENIHRLAYSFLSAMGFSHVNSVGVQDTTGSYWASVVMQGTLSN